MIDRWLAARVAEFAALRGRSVQSWSGVEMALRDDAPGGPQFTDPDVPCLQLLQLRFRLDDGSRWSCDTYQDDDGWGLMLARSQASAGPNAPEGIYRFRHLVELPTGVIRDVRVFLDGPTLAEVALRIGHSDLLLIAGELNEEWSGRLSWGRLDESVLAFTDPRQADQITWSTPRTELVPIT